MAELNINFGFVSNAQSLESNLREVNQTGLGFARLIVNEVAIAATEQAYKDARTSLVSSVRAVALREVSRMALLIKNSFALPDKYTGPAGYMSIKEGMSDTAKKFGFRSTFDRDSVKPKIQWTKRGKHYLKWKRDNGFPEKWWEATGDLADTLGNDSLYIDAFGPVQVLFTRARNQDKAKGGLSKSYILSGGGALEGQSSSSRLSAAVTQSGRVGRITAEYQIGKLEVITFGRITPNMLPGLATMDPKGAHPSGNIDGLAGLLPNDGPGGIRNKLLGKQEARRYALEPFVSFFLTRAIPNAIWRRTETLIAPSAIVEKKRT